MKTAGVCITIIAILFFFEGYLISSYLDKIGSSFDYTSFRDSLSNITNEYNSLVLKIKIISLLQACLLLASGICFIRNADEIEARIVDIEYNSTLMESRVQSLENNSIGK